MRPATCAFLALLSLGPQPVLIVDAPSPRGSAPLVGLAGLDIVLEKARGRRCGRRY